MQTATDLPHYRSIFSPSTQKERDDNFVSYWDFSQNHSGEMIEENQDLVKKRDRLQFFKSHPIRSQKPLIDPEKFYKNYVHLEDDPKSFDQKTLLLSCIYKFARHEWVGISAAWDYLPPMKEATILTDKISRYHLCEEFCHVRFFHEMFETFQLDRVQWVPLGPVAQRIYKMFPYFPESLMAPPAFVTELMGMTFYLHLDKLLDTVFNDEPEARDRLRELLHEIMADELAHIGQRRNFMGPIGVKVSRLILKPLYKVFFSDIPEAKYLFDIDQMIQEGLDFDYNQISEALLSRSWVPSYCQVSVTN